MAFDESLSLPTPARLDKRVGVSSPVKEVLDPWGEGPTETLSQFSPISLPNLHQPSPSWHSSELDRQNSFNSGLGWDNLHTPGLSTSDVYRDSFQHIDHSALPAIQKKSESNSSFDCLYSGPAVDFEAEIIEAKLNQRAMVFTEAIQEPTKTQNHPHQPKEFDWTDYKTKEMISFQVRDIPFIVEALITKIDINAQYETILAPANGLFLCARYAHHLQAPNLFDGLLTLSIHTIHNIVKEKQHDIINLSFWLTNCSQLLYYLKKDHGLCVATIEQQVLIPEILYDAYSGVVQGIQDQLARLLKSCMLEHDIIPGLDSVQFKENVKEKHTARPSSPRQIPYSPRTLITILDSLLNVLKNYLVPSAIIQRALSQVYAFISASLFNTVLENRRFCCRIKALQLRMNLSSLEEWARSNIQNPTLATTHLKSLVQLLELLQCASQLNTVGNFTDTIRAWDHLTASQANRALSQYYYEVDEPSLNPAILSLCNSWAARNPSMEISNLALEPLPAILDNQSKPKLKHSSSTLKNPHHMLPFGPPTQAEMSTWWEDYSPFLPFHIHQNLHSETAISPDSP